MAGRPSPSLVQFMPLWLALICGAASLVLLVGGWVLGFEWLVRFDPASRAMVPTTAVCFLLLSSALVLGWTCEGQKAWLAYRLVYGTIAIAVLNICDAILLGGSRIDALLVSSLLPDDGMSVAAAVGMLMASYCILALMAPENPDQDAPIYFAILGLSTSVAILVAFLFDASSLQEVYFFRALSTQSAILFGVLFAAVLAYPVDRLGTEVYRRS